MEYVFNELAFEKVLSVDWMEELTELDKNLTNPPKNELDPVIIV